MPARSRRRSNQADPNVIAVMETDANDKVFARAHRGLYFRGGSSTASTTILVSRAQNAYQLITEPLSLPRGQRAVVPCCSSAIRSLNPDDIRRDSHLRLLRV